MCSQTRQPKQAESVNLHPLCIAHVYYIHSLHTHEHHHTRSVHYRRASSLRVLCILICRTHGLPTQRDCCPPALFTANPLEPQHALLLVALITARIGFCIQSALTYQSCARHTLACVFNGDLIHPQPLRLQ
jgi:hypothetical protein